MKVTARAAEVVSHRKSYMSNGESEMVFYTVTFSVTLKDDIGQPEKYMCRVVQERICVHSTAWHGNMVVFMYVITTEISKPLQCVKCSSADGETQDSKLSPVMQLRHYFH